MLNSPNSGIRLAYWHDHFTVLSVRQVEVKQIQMHITQVLLYCRGRHALGYLRQTRLPIGGPPRPGDKVVATLRIGASPSSWRLYIQSIEII